MRLNQASDFGLRIMMLMAQQEEAITVDEIAQRLQLVKSHTMKIVAKLVKADLLVSTRGRSGGISLKKPSEEIMIGDIVRVTEADFAFVECMQLKRSNCVFAPQCKLRDAVDAAGAAFMDVLDRQTLQSVVTVPSKPNSEISSQ